MSEIDIRTIMSILPHRYPLLLVDRIVELEPGVRALGYKNITFNEPVFTGHFPGNPVFPGVYMIEAMAQLGGCVVLEPGEFSRKTPYLAGIDKAKFRKPVLPGDTIEYHMTKIARKKNMWWFRGKAIVAGQVVAEAEVGAMLS